MQQVNEVSQDVLITIHANTRDLEEKRAFADPEEHSYSEREVVSYGEILAILRASAINTGLDPKAMGL